MRAPSRLLDDSFEDPRELLRGFVKVSLKLQKNSFKTPLRLLKGSIETSSSLFWDPSRPLKAPWSSSKASPRLSVRTNMNPTASSYIIIKNIIQLKKRRKNSRWKKIRNQYSGIIYNSIQCVDDMYYLRNIGQLQNWKILLARRTALYFCSHEIIKNDSSQKSH